MAFLGTAFHMVPLLFWNISRADPNHRLVFPPRSSKSSGGNLPPGRNPHRRTVSSSPNFILFSSLTDVGTTQTSWVDQAKNRVSHSIQWFYHHVHHQRSMEVYPVLGWTKPSIRLPENSIQLAIGLLDTRRRFSFFPMRPTTHEIPMWPWSRLYYLIW